MGDELCRLGRPAVRSLSYADGVRRRRPNRRECSAGRAPCSFYPTRRSQRRASAHQAHGLFRLFLAIPHFIWLTLWESPLSVVAFILWLAILIEGKAPENLHNFVAGYVRYATHVASYVLLAANPYPGFRGAPGYPVDVEIDPPERQGRWAGFFRLILALPALLLASALGGGFSSGSPGQSSSWQWSSGGDEHAAWFAFSAGGAASAAAFLAWFAILVRGRAPRGLRDLTAFAIGYGAQAGDYLLLTPRYPTSDPKLAESYAELAEHPVRIVVTDDLERSRVTILLRLFLAIPHLIWLPLVRCRVFRGHRCVVRRSCNRPDSTRTPPLLAAYIRYATHVIAYVYVIGRRFPGFTGRARLRDRCRDRSAGATRSLEDRLSLLPRDPGSHPRKRSACGDRGGSLGLVVLARSGTNARGPPQPRLLVPRYNAQTWAYVFCSPSATRIQPRCSREGPNLMSRPSSSRYQETF